MVAFGIFLTKIWLVSVIFLIAVTALSYLYNKPISGITLKPELRTRHGLIEKLTNFGVCILIVSSVLLALAVSIDAIKRNNIKTHHIQRAQFFAAPSAD